MTAKRQQCLTIQKMTKNLNIDVAIVHLLETKVINNQKAIDIKKETIQEIISMNQGSLLGNRRLIEDIILEITPMIGEIPMIGGIPMIDETPMKEISLENILEKDLEMNHLKRTTKDQGIEQIHEILENTTIVKSTQATKIKSMLAAIAIITEIMMLITKMEIFGEGLDLDLAKSIKY
jgi:hypothetical protein